jgi:hypothetical protein
LHTRQLEVPPRWCFTSCRETDSSILLFLETARPTEQVLRRAEAERDEAVAEKVAAARGRATAEEQVRG